MRILVTGSRRVPETLESAGLAETVLRQCLGLLGADGGNGFVLVHGGARGADRVMALAARRLGMEVEAHPARWAELGRAAGPVRNREMVSRGASLCVAVPTSPKGRGVSGTWGCVEEADRAGLPVLVAWRGSLWAYNFGARCLLGADRVRITPGTMGA